MLRNIPARYLWPGLALLALLVAGGFAVAVRAAGPRPTPGVGPAPTAAAPAGPTLRINPAAGGPGTLLAIAGGGFPASTQVQVQLMGPVGQPAPQTYAVGQTDAEGRFSVSFPLPASWPDGRPIDEPNLSVLAATADGAVQVATALRYNALPGAVASAATETPAPVLPTNTANPPSPSPTPATPAAAATAMATTPPTTGPAASSTATAAPQAPAGNTGSASIDGLTLRTGPGTAYPTFGRLPAGSAFTVIGQNAGGDWLFVVVAKGQPGWVYRGYTDYRGTAVVVAAPLPPTNTPTGRPTPLPTATSTPPPAPTYVSGDWRGTYYANPDLAGNPALVRADPGIVFDWGSDAPAPGLPAQNFSVRWTRTVTFIDGTYRFHAIVDDGVRVYVDGTLVIDDWRDYSRREISGDIALATGSHDLRVEYYQRAGVALISVWWELAPPQGRYPDWQGAYFTNRDLTGDPALVRNDRDINFDWGAQGPLADQPDQDFSVRWTRSYDFSRGFYEFAAQADDGIRVYVDGQRIIDEWHDTPGAEAYRAQLALSGLHGVTVEYYQAAGAAFVHVWWYGVQPPAPATATPTATATRRPTAAATSTPTATPTSLPPTATATATPRPSAIPADTATATVTTAAAGDGRPPGDTPTPAQTSVPATPAASAADGPTAGAGYSVTLSEIFPSQQGDAAFIELYNSGDRAASLAGWQLAVAAASDTPAGRGVGALRGRARTAVTLFALPSEAVLQPNAYLALYSRDTGFHVAGGQANTILLVDPRGRVVDRAPAYGIPGVASLSRDAAGRWHSNWPPTPGEANHPPASVPDASGPPEE